MHRRTNELQTLLRGLDVEGQVAVVGHSHYFTYLTATEWFELEDGSVDRSQGPKSSHHLHNCEFAPLFLRSI